MWVLKKPKKISQQIVFLNTWLIAIAKNVHIDLLRKKKSSLFIEITDEETKSCRATVPDGQLSLAIGNKGQNARLAARLTGWRIDIRPESGFYGEDEDDEPKAEEKSEDVLDLDESTEGETVVSDETEE